MRRAPLDGETQGGSCQRSVLPALRWKSRSVFTADSADHWNLIPRSQVLPRLSVHFLLKRVDQSLIVCAHPEISIPRDRANLCWARSIVLLEHSELLSVPRRDEKFHYKGLPVSYRYESIVLMREQFSGQSMSTRPWTGIDLHFSESRLHQLRAHRYARVAAKPSTVLTACSRPHDTSMARDVGPASVSAIAFRLLFVGIIPKRV